jgi:endonuclease YncB( thermonuclease family)
MTRFAIASMFGALGATLLTLALSATPAAAHHSYDVDCSSFSTQASAQYHMNAHPGDPDGLDGYDDDGRACESSSCPCYYGAATQPEPAPSSPAPALPPTPAPPPAAPAPPPAPIAQPQPLPKRYSAQIVSVTDGDTIKVRVRSGQLRTVRLIGIDTPERRKFGVPVECGAKSATNFMTKLAFRRRGGRKLGHRVRLTTDATQDTVDRYGRLLAYVNRLSDDLDLGRSMIGKGWAMAYVYDSRPFQRFASYSTTERLAESTSRGVWASCGGDFHSEQ